MSAGRPSPARLFLLLSLMIFFWSFNYVAGKIALREFPPLLLVGMRAMLAALILLPIYLWRELWREPNRGAAWTWRELRVLLPVGLCGLTLNQTFFVLGLARTSVAHAAIAISLTPMLVLLLASAIGQERISARKLIGMAIAMAGIGVLQLGKIQGSTATLVGDLLVVLAAFTLAMFTVFGKLISSRYSGITVNTIANLGGAFVLTPLLWQSAAQFPFHTVSQLGWWSLAYMSVCSSVLGYLIFYYALKYVAASRVSVLSYFQPVLATLMALPILREPVNAGLLAGGLLALTGVYMTERS